MFFYPKKAYSICNNNKLSFDWGSNMWIFTNRLWLFFILLSYVVNLLPVLVSRAFYHKGRCEDKIVFYFDSNPEIKRTQLVNKLIYEFANMQIDPVAQKSLDNIARQVQKYQINFNYHDQTLRVCIDLGKQVANQVSVAQFKPISQPAGLVFKILHDDAKQVTLKQTRSCERVFLPKEIVLDFGHGGSDTGAMFGEIYEKDIVRNVGLKLAKLLEDHGFIVYLTRFGDEFVSLDERTYFANLHTNASLFLSLHANHASNQKISGLETYHMSDFLFNDLDSKLAGNNHSLLNSHSASLANLVHANVLQVQPGYKLIDRKVKQSVSQVLLGVEMPAILIELGFLSNTKEAKLLSSHDYQLQLASGIYNGIIAYCAMI